ncbi:MAG TPA: hypothetical protein VNI54_02800 [Thermoanaerobaculia bacterium]|nr:hypothetical protein [Thermoanaerobaculia bacterium]
MNSKRRAELQRKLTLNAVPRPPAGLVDRIRADIPKYLEQENERRRSSAFYLRVAASVLVAVTSVVAAMYVVNGPAHQEKSAAVAPGPFAPAQRRTSIAQDTPVAAPTETVRLEIAEETDLQLPPQLALDAAPPPPPAAVAAAPVSQARAQEIAEATPMVERQAENGVSGSVAGGVVGGTARGVVAEVARPQAVVVEREVAPAAPAVAAPVPTPVATSAPALEAPPPPPVMADAASRVGRATAERRAERSFAKEADREVFGISVDPHNFQQIRETLEAGARPAATAVDVEAIVNYFAGPPVKRPRRGVSLDVEASPAAIEAEGDHAILRFSIDTPVGGSTVVASNVRVDITFNDRVVAKHKRVGGDESLASESVLRNGMSVTGLYALELRPNLTATQRVATVRLQYKTVPAGKAETLTRHVLARDLAKSWARSTRRHRLASLGAVWGETLKGTAPGFDVARRAQELVTQDPKDARARELAAAANASSDGSR